MKEDKKQYFERKIREAITIQSNIDLLKILTNVNRLEILDIFYSDHQPRDTDYVSEELDLRKESVEKHLKKLLSYNLVRTTEKRDSYEITAKGQILMRVAYSFENNSNLT
jgi:predicted transcriptional regulator